MYQLTPDPSMIYDTDSNSIINAATSPDAWASYQAWLAEGNIPIPSSLSDIVPLSTIKQARIDLINEACEIAITSGFVSSALGSPHTYDSAIEDQINLIAATLAAMGGQSLEYKCFTETGEKQWCLHTPQQMLQVYSDGLVYKVTQMKKATYFKELINNATTPEEVEAIIWQ